MIKIIINKIVYQLKNSYDEITFSEYLQLLLNNNSPTPNIDNINFLSNIPKELINDFIYNLALPHIEFITATDLFRCNLLPNHIEAIRVGQESFLKIETAKVIIKNNGDKNIIHCIGQIVEIYSYKEQICRNIAEPEFDIKIATAQNSYLHERKFNRYAKIK